MVSTGFASLAIGSENDSVHENREAGAKYENGMLNAVTGCLSKDW